MHWDWYFCCCQDLPLLYEFVTQKAIWLAHWSLSFPPSMQPPIQPAICTFIHSIFIEPPLFSARQADIQNWIRESYCFPTQRLFSVFDIIQKKKKSTKQINKISINCDKCARENKCILKSTKINYFCLFGPLMTALFKKAAWTNLPISKITFCGTIWN